VVTSGGDEVVAGAPGGELIVRDRTKDDVAECVAILAEVHHRDAYPMRWPDDPAGFLTSPKISDAWVATLSGRIAGHVGLAQARPGDAAPKLLGGGVVSGGVVFGGGVVMVSRLFVSPAARGHGVGKVLLDHAAGVARQRGLHPVLDVDSTSLAAIALYERLGWHLLGTSEAQWGPHHVTVRSYAAPPPPGGRPAG
jgi:GNAT superfamily N-acetyltransferase